MSAEVVELKTEETPEQKAEAAQKILREDADRRKRACENELNEVLQKHNCRIASEMTFSSLSPNPQTKIVVVPR